MTQQKVVVKVNMIGNKKAQAKALKIAVSVHGVVSAAFVGPDKDKIEVTGDGINSVELTKLLRKKVGWTEIVTVGPIEDEETNYDGSWVWPARPYYSYNAIWAPYHM